MLHAQPAASLRDIAAALDVSLGKAHYCLHALVDSGWVRDDSGQRTLTASGLKAKARLSASALQQKQQEVATLRGEIAQLQRELGLAAGAGRKARS